MPPKAEAEAAGTDGTRPKTVLDGLMVAAARDQSSPPKYAEVLGSEDYADRLMGHLKDGTLRSEIRAAYEYAANHVNNKARGLTAAARSPEDCKKLASAGGTCIASSSLTALQLQAEALETLDTGKIFHTLTGCTTVGDIVHHVGTVLVNTSGWDGAEFTNLQRLSKDAEIQTLCLVLMWSTSAQLAEASADLVFEFRDCGLGTFASTYKLKMNDETDKERNVKGMSGWRQCVQWCVLADQMETEGRFE